MLGEVLSLADIAAGTSLYRYFELEIAPAAVRGRGDAGIARSSNATHIESTS